MRAMWRERSSWQPAHTTKHVNEAIGPRQPQPIPSDCICVSEPGQHHEEWTIYPAEHGPYCNPQSCEQDGWNTDKMQWLLFGCVLCAQWLFFAQPLHLPSVMATQTFLPFPNVMWFLAPSWTRCLFSQECRPLLSFLGTFLSYIQDPGASPDSTLEPFIYISFIGTFSIALWLFTG